MKAPTPFALSASLILACALGAHAATEPEVGKNWLLEPSEWSQPVERLERVKIVNHFGAVRVGGTQGDLAGIAELHGMAQRHTDDPRVPEVTKSFEDGLLHIQVGYPGDADVPRPPDAWRKRRIDITVYVAATSHLEIETLHGKVIVKGFEGPLDVASESGDVEIKTKGPVTALSKYGSIDTHFSGAALAHPLELETVTGAIHLSLPWQARPRALIETRGEISSDYSIGIAWLADSILKRGEVGSDEGSDQLVLRSNRGNVRLLRRIDDRLSGLSASTADVSERSP